MQNQMKKRVDPIQLKSLIVPRLPDTEGIEPSRQADTFEGDLRETEGGRETELGTERES